MSISKALPADAAELTALVNIAYRSPEARYSWATEAHLIDGPRIDEETMMGYLTAPDTTILKYTNEEGRIDACVYLQHQDNRLYLGMLSVFPHLQDRGLGRLLLQASEDFAVKHSCRVIRMTVISIRQELIKWYERRGYLPT